MLLLLVLIFAIGCGAELPKAYEPVWAADSLAQRVDPFIGTGADGNVFPGATVPWGMAAPSPHTRAPSIFEFIDTGKISGSGYVAGDPTIINFGMTHLSGTGCPELGAPVVAVSEDPLPYRKERAWPGYYSVELGQERVEMTASERGAMLRVASTRDRARVYFDYKRVHSFIAPMGAIVVEGDREISGRALTGAFCLKNNNQQNVYFVARFSRPFVGTDTSAIAGEWFEFAGGEPVEIAVGISYTSVEAARHNLDGELAGKSFDAVESAARASWEDALARVRVEGGTEDEQKIFYTALYHSLLHPSLASDLDGSHRRFGAIDAVGKDEAHPRYHVFSLWDTYRTLHPLLTLLYPERQREMVRSLANMTIEANAPPKWELAGWEVQMMVGDPLDIVFADSAVKNVLPDDGTLLRQAWPILQRAALDTTPMTSHRPANASYRALGYVPMEESGPAWGPVSTTLEYALADHSLVTLANALGVVPDPAFAVQAESWRNLIDPESKLFRPRMRDGSFMTPFDPDALNGATIQPNGGGPGYVEGTAYHYACFAPHAVRAHAEALGGAAAYVARLQKIFDEDRFAMWNEPDLAFPYLFSHFPGEEQRTRAIIPKLRSRYFTTARDGIPGNDDAGTMSAWYVFSALGFYPDHPGAPDYAVGTMLFDRATLTIGDKTLTLSKTDGSAVGARVPHATLTSGGTLRL